MTKKSAKPAYSVAMSKDTGAIVMVRTNGQKVTVMGSLSREDSLAFVKGILDWSQEVIREDAPRIMRLNG